MPETTPLTGELVERIRSQGPIPFPEFMQAALYHPEHGYYADPDFTTGREGDFATAPDAGPLMGATLARVVERFASEPGRLVEIGPGSGRMMRDVMEALGDEARQRLDVVLIEPFEARRTAALEALEGFDVRVAAALEDIGPGRTLVLANELLDALPCWPVRPEEHGWEALHIDATGTGSFEHVWKPAGDELAAYANAHAGRLDEGHVYEACPQMRAVLRDIADLLDPGAALLFDYGGRFTDIWPQRADGTLRGFRAHEQVDPLERPGETDITYDVDFTAAQVQARELGLEVACFGPQERLLVHVGLAEVARERGSIGAIKQMVVPGRGFAGRFQALVLDRGGIASELDLAVDLDDPAIFEEAARRMGGSGVIDPGLEPS